MFCWHHITSLRRILLLINHFMKILHQSLVLKNLVLFILLAKNIQLNYCHQILIKQINHDSNLKTCQIISSSKIFISTTSRITFIQEMNCYVSSMNIRITLVRNAQKMFYQFENSCIYEALCLKTFLQYC